MSSRERLRRVALGQEVDRVPGLGGWIGGVRVLADLAGVSVEQYLADPGAAAVQAHQRLGIDGFVGPLVPRDVGQIRTGALLEEKFAGVEPEALLDHARTLPQTEMEVLRSFDAGKVEADLREHFASRRRDWTPMEPIPNFWDLGGHFPLYHHFGYVAFLSACAMYPEAVQHIWWVRSLHSREKAKILVRLYRELDLVPLLFCGEDLCNNQGPMVSPEFLRRCYFPNVRMVLEPLVDAGVRVICHCDGDVRPVIDDCLAAGFSGLQGFQYELGFDPYTLAARCDTLGRPLLFFACMNVSRTLPFGTPQDVIDEVDWLFDWTDAGRRMFLFTTNVTGVEVPPDNLRAGYGRLRALVPGKRRANGPRPWPFASRAWEATVA